MARDWVKLWGCIVDDPEMCGMEDAAFKTLILALARAGTTDADGLVASRESLAWILHVDASELDARIARTGGRLEIRDGDVWVRDWAQWQSKRWDPTAEERKRRFQNGTPPAETPPLEAERNGTHENATERAETPDKNNEIKKSAPVAPAREDVDPDALLIPPARKPRKTRAHVALIEAASDALGYTLPIDPNLRAAASMVKDGFTEADVAATCRYLADQPDGFWDDKLISLATVHKYAGKVKAVGAGSNVYELTGQW